MEEGYEEFLFYHTEEPDCERSVMKIIHGTEAENRINGSDKEGNFPVLPSRKITNPTEEDTGIVCCVVITIDESNDTTPENAPEEQDQQQWNG